MIKTRTLGAVLPAAEFRFRTGPDGVAVATPVGPEVDARIVRLDVVRVPAGRVWTAADAPGEENVAVVFAGHGLATSGPDTSAVTRADTVYSPTGDGLALAAGGEGLTAYVWRTVLLDGSRPGTAPARFSRLWNGTTRLTGFAGTGQAEASARTATMNFLFWPGTGSPQLCLHCGYMRPGEYFNVHVHPDSEEAFFVFEGTGQLHLDGEWIDAGPGDVLFAAPGVPHGTRHPGAHDGRFATCGGPTPFDPVLYRRAGVSPEVI
ncbi:cupin domain-containing protein [Actinokineospora enzanensis]|uniref:cupin domain-containing protein n=1 Tax=Actinokineospora enzanensis TaxID=155975 RepID=UPI000372DF71|nr:cupin domain-containing protein [Actinokineospora enzanensis]